MRFFVLFGLLAYAVTGCQTTGVESTAASQQSAAVTEGPFNSEEDFRDWFAFYYKRPAPKRLTGAIEYMQTAGYMDDHPDVISTFVGKVVAANDDRVAQWSAEWQAFKPETWDVLLVALWLSGGPNARTAVRANLVRGTLERRDRLASLVQRDPTAADPLRRDVTDPRQINIIWAAFNASGDERYVRKVVSYVRLYGTEGPSPQPEIGKIAIVSLANNVAQHDVVNRVCMDENHNNADAKTRQVLSAMYEILAKMSGETGEHPLAH